MDCNGTFWHSRVALHTHSTLDTKSLEDSLVGSSIQNPFLEGEMPHKCLGMPSLLLSGSSLGLDFDGGKAETANLGFKKSSCESHPSSTSVLIVQQARSFPESSCADCAWQRQREVLGFPCSIFSCKFVEVSSRWKHRLRLNQPAQQNLEM